MAQVPTGTTFHIASAYSAAVATTIVTNAAEAVVTATAHGFSNGDFVEILSGWGRLNKRVFRIKSVAANTMTLEGADTTSTTFFSAGTGIGSVRKISTFTQITQVTAAQFSGGEPTDVEYKYVESDVKFKINDGFSASSGTLTLDADSIGTAGYTALKALTDVQTDTCMKMTTRSGSLVLLPCTAALNESISLQDGQINTVTASLSGNNRNTRYAS